MKTAINHPCDDFELLPATLKALENSPKHSLVISKLHEGKVVTQYVAADLRSLSEAMSFAIGEIPEATPFALRQMADLIRLHVEADRRFADAILSAATEVGR